MRGWIGFDPEMLPKPRPLTEQESGCFFEAIANGATIKAAGRLIGLTHATAHRVFEDYRATLGEQGE